MEHPNNTFIAHGPNQIPTEYHILFTLTAEDNGPCYMVYTDHSLTEDGSTCVFASIYEPDNAGGFLLPIENDWEWALIEQMLEQYSSMV